MSRISNNVDGYEFSNYFGRFSGTVELESEEAEAAAIGETLVLVVVANVSDANAKLDNKTGDLNRIAVLKATEARVLDPELKQLLVERLGLYGSDTVEPVLIQPKNVKVEVKVAPTLSDVLATFAPDVETGEISEFHPAAPFGDDTQLSFNDAEPPQYASARRGASFAVDEEEEDDIVVLGHVNGSLPVAPVTERPAVESFVEDDREILGRIKVSDDLASFLSEAA
jgi:hypothetical protein